MKIFGFDNRQPSINDVLVNGFMSGVSTVELFRSAFSTHIIQQAVIYREPFSIGSIYSGDRSFIVRNGVEPSTFRLHLILSPYSFALPDVSMPFDVFH